MSVNDIILHMNTQFSFILSSYFYLLSNLCHNIDLQTYVTQHELMRLFEGDIKIDILSSTYCSISKKHFDTKMIFISYSYQKL